VTEGSDNGVSERPFGLMLDALDDLKSNEVYICTGSSPCYALWGEMMSVRAMKKWCCGLRCRRLFSRYEGHYSSGIPHVLLWQLRAGSGAAPPSTVCCTNAGNACTHFLPPSHAHCCSIW
jgi:hypothetical protein